MKPKAKPYGRSSRFAASSPAVLWALGAGGEIQSLLPYLHLGHTLVLVDVIPVWKKDQFSGWKHLTARVESVESMTAYLKSLFDDQPYLGTYKVSESKLQVVTFDFSSGLKILYAFGLNCEKIWTRPDLRDLVKQSIGFILPGFRMQFDTPERVEDYFELLQRMPSVRYVYYGMDACDGFGEEIKYIIRTSPVFVNHRNLMVVPVHMKQDALVIPGDRKAYARKNKKTIKYSTPLEKMEKKYHQEVVNRQQKADFES